MGVLASYIPGSQPAYYGAGFAGAGIENATWRWTFQFTNSGAAVDISAVTTTCHIVDKATGVLVVAPTCSGTSLGVLTITVDETLTGSLSNGAKAPGRACNWWVTCNDGTDVLQLWGAFNSPFVVYPKAV